MRQFLFTKESWSIKMLKYINLNGQILYLDQELNSIDELHYG